MELVRSVMWCLVAVAAWVSPARAEELPLELSWDAPAVCPEGAAVASEVERLVAGAADATRDRLVVRATVREDEAGLRLTLEMELAGAAPSVREIEGSECSTLASAAALVVALALDPSAAERLVSGAEEPMAPEVPAPVEETAAPTALVALALAAPRADAVDRSARRAPERSAHAADRRDSLPERPDAAAPAERAAPSSLPVRATLAVRAVAAVGPLPSLAPGVEVAGGARFRRFSLELGGTYLGEQGAEIQTHASAGGSFWAASGRVRGCVALLEGRFEAGPCAAIEVGAVHGEARGVSDPRLGTGVLFGAAATAYAAVEITPWLAAHLELGVVAWPVQPRFTIDGLGPVYEPSPIGARGVIGLEARFGSRRER